MKLLSKTSLALYLLILSWLVLFKFSLDLSAVFSYRTGLNLVPFADFSRNNLGDAVLNFAVFVPLGLLLAASSEQMSFWRKLAAICMFSLTLETIQFVFAIGVTDVTDVVTNTTGGLVGLALHGTYSATEKD